MPPVSIDRIRRWILKNSKTMFEISTWKGTSVDTAYATIVRTCVVVVFGRRIEITLQQDNWHSGSIVWNLSMLIL